MKKLSKIFVWILAVIIAFTSYYYIFIYNKPTIIKKNGYIEIRVGNEIYIDKDGIIERIK